jgi:hypothetical protein
VSNEGGQDTLLGAWLPMQDDSGSGGTGRGRDERVVVQMDGPAKWSMLSLHKGRKANSGLI